MTAKDEYSFRCRREGYYGGANAGGVTRSVRHSLRWRRRQVPPKLARGCETAALAFPILRWTDSEKQSSSSSCRVLSRLARAFSTVYAVYCKRQSLPCNVQSKKKKYNPMRPKTSSWGGKCERSLKENVTCRPPAQDGRGRREISHNFGFIAVI